MQGVVKFYFIFFRPHQQCSVALHLGITLGNAQKIIWGDKDQSQPGWPYARQKPYCIIIHNISMILTLYYCSGPWLLILAFSTYMD